MENNTTLPVTAKLHYNILLKCPHCESSVDLNQEPYVDSNGVGISHNIIRNIFGEKENCLCITYECCHCKKPFVLTQIKLL